MPAKWWQNTKAQSIYSLSEFNQLVNGEMKDKHIFIDFYMQ